MRTFVKQHIALLSGYALLSVLLFRVGSSAISHCGGHLVYALDDPYIHMAIAKNVTLHGVWGVDRYHFCSASSSILWPLLLIGAFFIFGVRDSIPLALNILLAFGLLLLTYHILKKRRLPNLAIFVALVTEILLVPLPLLVFTGLEHVLHCISTLALAFYGAEVIAGKSANWKRDTLLLSLLAIFAMMARYESMALILFVVLGLAIRKRPLQAAIVGAAALTPLIVFGLISIHYGAFFFPNSIMLKSQVMGQHDSAVLGALLGVIRNKISWHEFLSSLLVIPLAYFVLRRKKDTESKSNAILSALFVLALLAQIAFGRLDAFYRYEGYVITLGIVVISLDLWELTEGERHHIRALLKTSRSLNSVILVTLILTAIYFYGIISFTGILWIYRYEILLIGFTFISAILLLLAWKIRPVGWVRRLKITQLMFVSLVGACILTNGLRRGVIITEEIPVACGNIYDQQYQMGLFIKRFFTGRTIGLNDIGCVDYLADIHCLDLWGLANMDSAKLRLHSQVNGITLYQLAQKRDMALAIIYDSWFPDAIPPQWIKTGQWRIHHNIVAGDSTVSFYAPDKNMAAKIESALSSNKSLLPKDVAQSGDYSQLQISSFHSTLTHPTTP